MASDNLKSGLKYIFPFLAKGNLISKIMITYISVYLNQCLVLLSVIISFQSEKGLSPGWDCALVYSQGCFELVSFVKLYIKWIERKSAILRLNLFNCLLMGSC